jgi:hypothetical protein
MSTIQTCSRRAGTRALPCKGPTTPGRLVGRGSRTSERFSQRLWFVRIKRVQHRHARRGVGPNLAPSSLPLFLVCDLDDGLIFALRRDVDLGVFAGASDH